MHGDSATRSENHKTASPAGKPASETGYDPHLLLSEMIYSYARDLSSALVMKITFLKQCHHFGAWGLFQSRMCTRGKRTESKETSDSGWADVHFPHFTNKHQPSLGSRGKLRRRLSLISWDQAVYLLRCTNASLMLISHNKRTQGQRALWRDNSPQFPHWLLCSPRPALCVLPTW